LNIATLNGKPVMDQAAYAASIGHSAMFAQQRLCKESTFQTSTCGTWLSLFPAAHASLGCRQGPERMWGTRTARGGGVTAQIEEEAIG